MKTLKTAVAYFLSLLLILLLSSIFLISCKAKIINDTTAEKTINHDSISQSKVITRNAAIIDSLKVVIGKVYTNKKECDSVCQIAIDKLLSQLNSKKQSGANSAGVFYDTKTKTINVATTVGATQSDSSQTFRYITKTYTLIAKKEVPVKEPLTKFQLFLMISGIVGWGVIVVKTISFFKPIKAV